MGNSAYKGHSPSGHAASSYAKLVHTVYGHMPMIAHDSLRKGNLLAIDHHLNTGIICRDCDWPEVSWRSLIEGSLNLPWIYGVHDQLRSTQTAHSAGGELKKGCQSASEFLYNCDAKCLTEIKSFAKNGGPDLSGLRGVWYMLWNCSLLIPKLTISGSIWLQRSILETA
jgi:hypothetical protein